MFALHPGGDRADHPAESADQGRRAALGDGDGKAAFAAGGGDLRAGEPGPDDEDPLGSRCEPPGERGTVVATPQHENAVEFRLGRARPRSRPHPRGDQQPVVRHLVAVGQPHQPGGHLQAGGRNAEPPGRVDGSEPGQCGAVGAGPAQQHLLGERGPVVRFVGLVADHGQGAREALGPQGFGSAQPGQ